MENNKYMTREEYEEEWKETGENDFLEFLNHKIQEASVGGNEMLAAHIYRIYDAVDEEQDYEAYVERMTEEFEESLNGMEITELEEKHEGIVEEIKQKQRKIDEIITQIKELDDDYVSLLKEVDLENDISDINGEVQDLQEKAKILQEKIKKGQVEKIKEETVGEEESDKLEDLSLEELQKLSHDNEQQILTNEQQIQVMKQALIDKILGQQQIIARQQEELAKLKNQKEL